MSAPNDAEERAAWDLYAAAGVYKFMYGEDTATYAAHTATKLLAERRKMFPPNDAAPDCPSNWGKGMRIGKISAFDQAAELCANSTENGLELARQILKLKEKL